jgi:hypothetical protein
MAKAKGTKGLEKKGEEKQSHERLFQVFLLVLGCVLGALATRLVDAGADRRQKQSIIRAVKADVQQGVCVARILRELLATKKDVERLLPQVFDSTHDPSLYFSLQDSLGQLDGALLLDYQAFHRTMQSCINLQRVFQEGLLWCQKNKGKPLPEGYKENYITALGLLEVRGQKVISTIETLYPKVKLDPNSKRASPIVTVHDINGYVRQE